MAAAVQPLWGKTPNIFFAGVSSFKTYRKKKITIFSEYHTILKLLFSKLMCFLFSKIKVTYLLLTKRDQ